MGRRSRHRTVRWPTVRLEHLRRGLSRWYRDREESYQLARVRRAEVRPGRWQRSWQSWQRWTVPLVVGAVVLVWLARSPADVAAHFFSVLLGLGLGYTAFLLSRYLTARRWYLNRARSEPQQLVETAGSILDKVVGRDQLCEVLIEQVRNPSTRRPHVLAGGVGVGKTATLVKLAQMLAQRKVVAVPVRLRDAQQVGDLDFRTLAQKRLGALLDEQLRSSGDADKIWRQLCRDNRVVVLADGLEEALTQEQTRNDRDSQIRLAISRAIEQHLPLIIASRPHDPLRGMDATVIEMGPLGEGPALDYVTGNGDGGRQDPTRGTGQDWQRVTRLVQAVDAVDAPLYLQIIRELDQVGLLGELLPRREGGADQPVDRSWLRRVVLEAWRNALIEGHLSKDYALERNARAAAIEVLSALACVGLKLDSTEVRFSDLIGTPSAGAGNGPPHGQLLDALAEEVRQSHVSWDVRSRRDLGFAATMGAQLGVVHAHEDGVHFQHRIIQAYLGSRYLPRALRDRNFLRHALETPRPGRELLIALVLHSRSPKKDARSWPVFGHGGWTALAGRARHETDASDGAICNALVRAAGDEKGIEKILDIYAAALEIDSVATRPDHSRFMAELAGRWAGLSETTAALDRTVDEAKLGLVWRFSDAARHIAQHRYTVHRHRQLFQPAYATMYGIASRERSYLVRLAAARVIGEGGNEAVASLPQLHKDIPDAEQIKSIAGHEAQLRAWLAPLLYYSCRPDPQIKPADLRITEAQEHLQKWLDVLSEKDPKRRLPISSEIALAQGFKLAANMREFRDPGHAQQQAILVEKAEFALAHARFWHSRLALVQALTMLSLPDDPAAELPTHGHGSDPAALVGYWLGLAGHGLAGIDGERPEVHHPFVIEAAELCILALRHRRPEQFCWIDESESLRQIGSYSASRSSQRTQPRWILNSVGWDVLHPRAQRLLADVLLMLNLAERGGRPAQLEERLNRADRPDLPPCLTTDRSPLDPKRTIGSAQVSEPGSNCTADCGFRLCPYPPRGTDLQRAELSESFCRNQAALLGPWYDLRARAPWQALLKRDLKDFWRQMAERELPASRP